MSVRLAADDDWPAILDVHAAAFGDEDVARLARELHESDVYVPGAVVRGRGRREPWSVTS